MLTQSNFKWLVDDYHINRLLNTYIGDCGVCARRRWGGIETTWHILDNLSGVPIDEADICDPCVIHYGFINERVDIPELSGIHFDIAVKKGQTIYIPCGCGRGGGLGNYGGYNQNIGISATFSPEQFYASPEPRFITTQRGRAGYTTQPDTIRRRDMLINEALGIGERIGNTNPERSQGNEPPPRPIHQTYDQMIRTTTASAEGISAPDEWY